MRALIIEPSIVYQMMLGQLLEDSQFETDAAKSGQEAIDKIEQDDFDLICVAMQLSDLSGIELCRKIRDMGEVFAHIPIIMITSEEDRDTLVDALIAGATEIFKKTAIARFTTYLRQFVWKNTELREMGGDILYVEDSLAVASVTCSLLQHIGMNVKHCESAEEAFEEFKQRSYDLVLADVVLSGEMTGHQLVQQIRSHKEYNNIPILAMSGIDDASRRVSLLKDGANDYVAKPFLNEELVARVQNLVRSKRLFDQVNAQQEYLRELAMKDQLTGLYNRHFLMEVGPKKIAEAHRHSSDISMIVVDLDKFKAINDNHGHSVGDDVLSGVGNLLSSVCRQEDVAARFGGEEFVLILHYCNLTQAIEKAEEIRLKVQDLKPAGLVVTASLGVSALNPGSGEDMAALFGRADQAVYKAKETGRNKVVSQ